MAQEITVITSIQATKGTFILPKYGGTVKVDQANAGGGVPGTQDVTNAAQGVALISTGIGTLGWVYLLNLDPVAVVDYGPDNAGNIIIIGSMKPGEPALFRLKAGTTLRLKSSVASSKIQAIVLEN